MSTPILNPDNRYVTMKATPTAQNLLQRIFTRVREFFQTRVKQRKEIKAITLQEAAKKQARAIVNRRFAHRQAVLQGYVHKSMLVADGKGHNTLQGIPQKP